MDPQLKKKKGQNELGVITKRPGNATHFPAPGCTCRVHYEARLENGDVFDSSRDRKRALIFKLGAGQLIPGLEDGIPKMSVGQICVFTVPPALGYGQEGFMPVVPPVATLTSRWAARLAPERRETRLRRGVRVLSACTGPVARRLGQSGVARGLAAQRH